MAASEGGLVGLAVISTAIVLAATDPPPWLDKSAYFLLLSGAFFAGVTRVVTSISAADGGASGAPEVHQAQGFEGEQRGILGLAVASVAVTLAATASQTTPQWLDETTYFLALSGTFFAGVTHVATEVWAADGSGRRRRAAGKKFVCFSVVVPLVVAVGLWVPSLLG